LAHLAHLPKTDNMKGRKMTEEQAIEKVSAEFHPRLKAAGLIPYVAKIKQADQDGNESAVLALAQEMEQFPVWREYRAEMDKQRISPEMHAAIAVFMNLQRAGLGETDEGHIAMMKVMDLAPEWLLDEFGDMGREMGVMPSKPTGYTDEGEPMYSLDAIGAALDLTEAEAAEELERFMELRQRAGLSNNGIVTDGGLIHGVH
jgi:hypothetical protein